MIGEFLDELLTVEKEKKGVWPAEALLRAEFKAKRKKRGFSCLILTF